MKQNETIVRVSLTYSSRFFFFLSSSPTYRVVNDELVERLRRRWIRARTKSFVILCIRYTFMNRNMKRKSLSIMSTYISMKKKLIVYNDRIEHQIKSINHPMCVHIKQPKAIFCFSSSDLNSCWWWQLKQMYPSIVWI